MATNITTDDFLSRLEGVRPTGPRQWYARCPSHDDQEPSLSVADGERVHVLLYCHAGCPSNKVVEALGLDPEVVLGTKKRPTAFYIYRDALGEVTHRKLRFDPKSFVWQHLKPDGTWANKIGSTRVGLYRLHDVATDPTGGTVFVVEGEKDADRLHGSGLVAISNPHGSKPMNSLWKEAGKSLLQDRDIVILPDNDVAGSNYAETISRLLANHVRGVRIVRLPDLAAGEDVSDFLDRGGTIDDIHSLVAETSACVAVEIASGAPETRVPPAPELVFIAQSADLFHTPEGEAYAILEGKRLVAVDTDEFRDWVASHYYAQNPFTVLKTRSDLPDAFAKIKTLARTVGPERAIFNRVARIGETYYFDYGAEPGSCIEVSDGQWTILEKSPVVFMRDRYQAPLPMPDRAGDLVRDLRPLLDPIDDSPYRTIVGWILASAYDVGTRPILALTGPPGAGKTSTTKLARDVLDPRLPGHDAPKSLPDSEEDLFINAAEGPVLAIDNVSFIEEKLQDALCKIASGGTYDRRTKYSNRALTSIAARCAVVLNSVTDVVSRGDLLSRTLVITNRAKTQFRTQSDLDAIFRSVHPKIFGGFLTAFASGLANLKNVATPNVRLADFSRFVIACEPALGWPAGIFEADMLATETDRAEIELEGSYLSEYVERFARNKAGVKVTPSKLYEELYQLVDEKVRPRIRWPKDASALSRDLKRIESALARKGFHTERGKTNGHRWIAFHVDPGAEAPSTTPDFRVDPVFMPPITEVQRPGDEFTYAPTVLNPETKKPYCFGKKGQNEVCASCPYRDDCGSYGMNLA